jgi:soluble lytic murein transglycosylase
MDCLTASKRAIATSLDPDLLVTSLRLGLECATESGQLETALESWRALEASKWDDPRREWLGRRLGVALARTAQTRSATLEIASSLRTHQRCLRYWGGGAVEGNRQELEDLATASPADLYGQWARQALGMPGPQNIELKPPIEIGEAPPPVQRLLEMGAEAEAVREWRRVRRHRGSSPDEALAASEFAAQRGLPNEMIRWLRVGFPELGTVEMASVPANAVQSYLPLRWHTALIAAAREADVDPWLVAAVARQESIFSAHARSPRGAIGVLQLVPQTARDRARVLGMNRSPNLLDPETNLRLGAHELARLMRRFGTLEPTLAAYNAGETRVRKWWRRWPEPQRFTEEIPIPETYNYVRRVMFLSESYRLVHEDIWGRTP